LPKVAEAMIYRIPLILQTFDGVLKSLLIHNEVTLRNKLIQSIYRPEGDN